MDRIYTPKFKKNLGTVLKKLTHKQLVDRMLKMHDVLNRAHTCVQFADLNDRSREWEGLLDGVENMIRAGDLPYDLTCCGLYDGS